MGEVVEKVKYTECDEFSSLKIPKDSLKAILIADPDNSIVFDVPFGGLLYVKELEIERVGNDKWKILLPKGSDRQRWVIEDYFHIDYRLNFEFLF